jgi:ribose transport system permease protein
MGYTGAASDSTGTGFEMNVMVSLILGGMPLKGGMKSRLSCAIIGSLTFSLLAVGLPIIGVPTRMTFMIKAIIFLVVVLITCRQKSGPLPR